MSDVIGRQQQSLISNEQKELTATVVTDEPVEYEK